MEPILTVRKMDKNFGATVALRQVDLDVYSGEIRGLIGENGSGKSTLTSIIAGIQKADSGEIRYHGKTWEPVSMIDALEHGIGMIVQETGTIPGITVAENLFLGECSQFRNKLGLISRRAMEKESRKALDVIHADHIQPGALTASLDLQERKLVEVAKVMVKQPEILIVDETTTALSQKGRELLYQLMNDLKDTGKAVIFISHDLDEIKSVCDTLTVLRDGKIITHFSKENYNDDEIKTSMIGREMQGDYYRADNEASRQEAVLLEAEHLTGSGLKDVSLKVHAGEVLGIGGLSECGMHDLGKALFGSAQLTAGKVSTEGKTYSSEKEAAKFAGRLEGVTDFLMIPEYLMYRLCGVKSHEYTNATTGGMISVETGEYDPEIISALELPKHLFRPLQKPGTMIGEYKGIKVMLCATHDTGSAVEGIPMEGNELYISSGTWSLLGVKTPKPLTDEASRAANYSNEGGVGYNRYQKNIMGMWLPNELRREICPERSWDEIVSEAESSQFAETMDANAQCFLAPKSMKQAFDDALKNKPRSLGDYFRCAYMSLALSYKNAIRELEQNTGKEYKQLYIVGGGAKNRFLNRLTEEMTGKEVIALPIEATALGNLKIQMEADQ